MKKSNLKILILIGIPASGKSKWAKEYIRKQDNYVRVNRDDFRLMLKDAQQCENKIVDNTNLQQKYIDAIIERFKYQADIDYQIFDISLAKAIERDSAREGKVGAGVITKMFKSYKELMDGFDFAPIKKIEHRPHLKPDFSSKKIPAVIFDIDGTLALMGRRSAFDWDKVDVDDINEIVSEQVAFHRFEGRTIILVSGRDSVCRQDTIDWMEFYGIKFDELYMRPANDFRKDTVIKEEIYNNEIRDKYNVLCVFDDRMSVCRKWADMGLFTFTVNQGLLEF